MRVRGTLCIAAIIVGIHFSAEAQPYPNRPIHVVIGTGPGSFVDTIARVLANKMSEMLGQPFIPENRGGASGQIATEIVARAVPDGYTLLVASPGPLAVNPHFAKLPYDPLKDFVPVAVLATTPAAIAVNASLPATTFQEFLAYARAKPGAVSYGHAGVGGMMNLCGEQLKVMAGISMVGVPYRGAAAAATAIATGEVQVGLADLQSLKPLSDIGRIRILALVDPIRTDFAPDIPTIAESGLPGYDGQGWAMLLAPAGTPAEIVARLNANIWRVYEISDVLTLFRRVAIQPMWMTPEDSRIFLRKQFEKWGKLIQDVGIKPQ